VFFSVFIDKCVDPKSRKQNKSQQRGIEQKSYSPAKIEQRPEGVEESSAHQITVPTKRLIVTFSSFDYSSTPFLFSFKL
jgi:hypothetical protein